jgi:site-specific recombinase XerD
LGGPEAETIKKPTSNRSAKERRNTLFCVLEGILSLSHKKIHSEVNSDRAKQGGQSLAFILQNLRLKEIGLRIFRHWKATIEYNKTRDILQVQQLLGHRDLRNTLIYINLRKSNLSKRRRKIPCKNCRDLTRSMQAPRSRL